MMMMMMMIMCRVAARQHALCDPIWQVTPSSSVMTLTVQLFNMLKFVHSFLWGFVGLFHDTPIRTVIAEESLKHIVICRQE